MTNIEDIYELSPMQQGMLFHEVHAPEAAAYFEQTTCVLRGPLNRTAFEQAWQQALDRHPALRTSFHWTGLEKPVQVVHRAVALPWHVDDWQAVPAQEQELRLQAFLEADRQRGFDLAAAPLMRCALMQLAPQAHRFVWSHHHILFDGWSRAIVLQDVMAAYDLAQRGQPAGRSPQSPAPRRFRDYIAWLQAQDRAAARRFWEQRLQGVTAPTVLRIEGDRAPRPAGHAEETRRLSPAQTDALRALAHRHQVTFNTLAQGAWAVLLQRYANVDDVVLGMTVSGRPPELPGSDRMVGLFINTLPLRVRTDPGMPVVRWLKRMQDSQSEQDQYAYTPLADIQTWSDIPAGSALFDHVFTFENFPVDAALRREDGALEIQDVRYSAWTNYPLSVLVAPGPELTFTLIYDRQRFDADAMSRMAEHYVNVLDGIAAQPDRRVADLPLLGPSDRERILVEWNRTRLEVVPDGCLHHLVEAQVDRTPDAVAVRFEDGALTYRELDGRANQLARYLASLGVGPDVVVALCLERSLDLVVALLGVLKAGGAYLPLDPEYPHERMRFILAASAAPVTLSVAHLRDRLPAGCARVVCLDTDWPEIAACEPTRPASGVGIEHLAYVLFTSGSTGAPKGVMIPHRALSNHMLWMAAEFPLQPADRVLQKTPYGFDASVWEFWAPLMAGAQLVMARPGGHQDSTYLVQAVQAHQVTILQLVPSVLQVLLDTPGVEACTSLRRVFCGGEALSPSVRDRFFAALPAELVNLYGPTEATIDTLAWRCARDQSAPVVPIGRPVANTQVYVLDRHQQPVPVGVPGELYLGGASLARGYLGRPDLTAERFVPSPFSPPPASSDPEGWVPGAPDGRLYATGDAAAWQMDGSVVYLGRSDHQVKLRGFRIELGEIEAALRDAPGVREALVVLREDEPGHPQLVAYVILEPGASPTEGVLRLAVGARLPEYMIPAAFVVMPAFPLTAHGKADRRKLPVPDRGSQKPGAGATRTPTESVVENVWAHVLGLERIDAAASFFELGGHSLSAMQVLARVREIFRVDIPLRALFEAPRLADFAARVDAARTGNQDDAAPAIEPADRHQLLPLSFAQERLWFLQQLVPGNPFYTIPMAVRWQGPVDRAVLTRVLDEIVRRHEVLRTTFSVVDGQPRQAIQPPGPVTLAIVDLQTLTAAEQADALEGHLHAAQAHTFDLTAGPLVRFTLIAVAPTESVLVAVMHHIATDGWSVGVFARELIALYQAFSRDEPSPLPDLQVQYGDYAVWQRQWLHGGWLARQRQYWQQQLRGAPQVLELPSDAPRPRLHTFRGRAVPIRIESAIVRQLRRISQHVGASLYMTLLTGFAVLLSRSTRGVGELVVSTPIANRPRRELESLIGFFVNTLALRLDLSGDPTVEALLRRIRETVLEAYAHQDVPFEQVVEELQPARDLSRNPLVQVSFAYHNLPFVETEMAHGRLTPCEYAPETVRFDLEVHLWDTDDGGLAGTCLYYADLFAPTTIEGWMAHLVLLLDALAPYASRRISELPLMSPAEQQRVLLEWSGASTDAPHASCIHQVFERRVTETPEAVAVETADQRLTYRGLNARANQCAGYLRTCGVGPDVLVGLCCDRSLELIVGLLGILKAGGAYVPLDPAYPPDRLAFMLADTRAPVILTQHHLADRLPASATTWCCLDRDWATMATCSDANPECHVTPEHLAYVMYTSGSTGRPKGTCVPHRAVVRLVRDTGFASLTANEVFLQLAPISFDASTMEVWGALLNGATLVVPPPQPPSMEDLGRILRTHHVTTLWLTAGLFHLMAEHHLEALRPVRQLLAGGDVLAPPIVRKVLDHLPGCRLINGYGPTENTTFTCTYPFPADWPGTTSAPIGTPIANTQVYILDEHLQPVPAGVPGELYTGGAGLARGYLNQPELTAEKFVPNPFLTPSLGGGRDGGGGRSRLYRTGDLARYLPDGTIEFLGRADDQVKIRGFRIEPGEVETVLRACPGIAEAAVVPRAAGSGDKELVAYVVSAAGHSVARRAVREFLKARLPEYMLPAALVELAALPLGPNGKIDRQALPAPDVRQWDDAVAETAVGPRTPVEAVVQSIWAAVLQLETVGLHADFFELGGHSLLATQVVSRVREVFQVEMPLRQMFETPTVAGLAEALERLRSARTGLTAPPISPTPHDAPLPLSFAQERLWFLEQLVPGNPFYNTPLAIEMHGHLDEQALRRTLDAIVERHEPLRTTITTVGGRPQQVVHPAHAVAVAVEDLTAWPEEARAAQARAYAFDEGQRPFDLTQGPLLRAAVVRLAPTHHLLLLTMHHIVSDGWSLGVLSREFRVLYAALTQGETPQLPGLAVQYADFAVWQRGWLQGDVLSAQVEYWHGALQDAPLVLELPADHARPPVHTFRGQAEGFTIGPETVAQLKRLSRAAGASLYMTVLSAFAVLLARHADVDELLIGTPIANRTRQELEPLIGFFVNTLALRIDLRDNPDFVTLLRRVRQCTLDAYAHQDVPFEQLVEDLQPDRDMSRTPVVQVSLAYQNAPVPEVEIPGVTLQPLALDSGTVRFDLEVHVWETPSGALTGSCLYYAEIFEAETIRRMLASWATLMAGIATDPERQVATLPLLTPAEQHDLLVSRNTTAAPYPRDRSAAQLFTAQAGATPDAVAVTAGQERLTFRELDERANRLAHYLRTLGVGPDVLVGVSVERSTAMVVGLLGVLKAGGAYVPLDPEYPQDRLQYMVSDARMGVVLTQERIKPLFAGHALAAVCLDTDWSAIAQSSADDPAWPVAPDHLAYVIYTSGSTGRPKGTMIPHKGLVNYLTWCTRAYRVADGQGAPVHSSISFDATITSLLAPLVVGRPVVLLPERQEIEALRDALQAQADFSLIKITPAHLDVLRQLVPPRVTGGQARAFVIGGEALLGSQLSFWRTYAPGTRLINEYGPTETVVGCCVFEAQDMRASRGPVPIGRPIANTQLYVLDHRLQPVPVGVYGELYIGGDGLARGYLHRPDVTAERFVPSPFGPTPGARLYRTGDVVRYLADGNLEYRGRCDHQVKIRGYRIEPEEIEALLTAHPAVADAIVMAREDQADDKRLVAYVVPAAEAREEVARKAASGIEKQQLGAWQQVFQDSYSHPAPSSDATFDISGWNSSYTGLPIPAAEMREWVDQTVARILALQPRDVLEIGCGTGLLLARIAPQSGTYWGADFSAVALRHVQHMKAAFPWGDRVTLLHRPADDFSGMADGQFDTVVLNSVAQYFPSVEYLVEVVSGALRVLRGGGALFLGDLRSLPLLGAYHASVQVTQAAPDVAVGQLRQAIRRRMLEEEELVVDPALFAALPQHLPRISSVDIQYKRGQAANELTKFRYDVVLTVGADAPPADEVAWRDWPTQPMTADDLRGWLAGSGPQTCGLRRVANARLREERAMLTWLRDAAAAATVAAFRQQQPERSSDGFDPEELWRIGAECGRAVRVVPEEEAQDGSFSALFQRAAGPSGPPMPPSTNPRRPWTAYANNPLRRRLQGTLIPELRRYLADKVPTYMVPAAYVLLDAFPLTQNGKIDRRALPAPDSAAAGGRIGYEAPRTPTQEVVAAIWADVLNLDRVGLQDHFFHLGGHSLLATQVISRLREAFAVEVPVRQMFEAPTVADFSARLESLTSEQRELPGAPPLCRAPRTAPVPLSFAQERLWFLDQLEGPNATYNSPVAVRMTGRLDVQALEESLTAIGNRHDTLRTTFALGSDGRPTQRVASDIRITLPVVDLSSGGDQERLVTAHLTEEAARPFDLTQGPLVRGTLLRVGIDDHLLCLTMHHIVSDAWSTGVFVRELAALYAAELAGQPAALPPLPIQYGDFAVWQRGWLQGDVLDAQLAYWRAQLQGSPPLLALPTDRPRPAVQTFRGSSCAVELDAALTKQLNALSQRAGVSLFMTLLAAFAALLGRYSGADDLVVGSPIANRNRREIEGLIGFFVNTLALRIDLAGHPSFLDLLARVRHVALDAYAHQDVPFEVVVDALQPERHLSHHPVFQTMFVLQNTPAERLELPDLTLTPVPQEHQTAKFDLLLSLTELDSRLTGWLEYSTDLFDGETIRRMIGHFTHLLTEIVAAPERSITRLPWLTDAERQQVLRWNQTSRPVPPCSVAQMFEQQVERTPDALALEFSLAAGGEDQQLTYQALNSRANQLARHLRRRGAGPDVPIGVSLDRSIDLLVAVLAILKAGSPAVPLDPAYPAERLALIRAAAGAPLVVTRDWLVHEQAAIALCSTANLDTAPAPDDLVYILYTSGSTGTPKGVALCHRALANLLHWQASQSAAAVGTKTLQFTSLSFDVSFQEVFATWCTGGRLVQIADDLRRDARELLRVLEQERIERLFLPFVALQQLAVSAQEAGVVPASLREVITAGEQLQISPALVWLFTQLPECQLHNHYGPSETHVVTAYSLTGPPADWPVLPPIGAPIANTHVFVLGEDGDGAPVGVPGELFVGGACLARGYWRQPDLTAERFVPSRTAMPSAAGRIVGSADGERLYRTGDMARYRPDGNIEFLGRRDQQVKIRGFRVEPGEIETVLATHADVLEAVVVPQTTSAGLTRLVAYVVPAPGRTLSVTDVRQYVKATLPEYMVPAAFVPLEQLPLTPSGKINRRALPPPDVTGAMTDSRGLMPRDGVELQLMHIWEAVLERSPVGVHDDFFDLGGHSLLAVRLMASVQQHFGRTLPLATLFQRPTIAQLAALLRQRGDAEPWSVLVPIRPGQGAAPFFCVPGAGGNVVYFAGLARHVGRPFYGLQALGLDGRTSPQTSIEDVAATYVAALQEVQSQGPYWIGGHSFGGWVAYEMAQQLQRQGQSVALLVIFDTPAPPRHQPLDVPPKDDAAWLSEITAVIGSLFGKPMAVAAERLQGLSYDDQLAVVYQTVKQAEVLPPDTDLRLLRGLVDVYRAHVVAMTRYIAPVTVLPTPIRLVRAADPDPLTGHTAGGAAADADLGWGAFAAGPVDTVVAPGDHRTMLNAPQVEAVARYLRRWLEQG